MFFESFFSVRSWNYPPAWLSVATMWTVLTHFFRNAGGWAPRNHHGYGWAPAWSRRQRSVSGWGSGSASNPSFCWCHWAAEAGRLVDTECGPPLPPLDLAPKARPAAPPPARVPCPSEMPHPLPAAHARAGRRGRGGPEAWGQTWRPIVWGTRRWWTRCSLSCNRGAMGWGHRVNGCVEGLVLTAFQCLKLPLKNFYSKKKSITENRKDKSGWKRGKK